MNRMSPERRRFIMSRIRSKDTHPEMVVRRLVHGLGYRYRLHVRELPGTPDIVLPRHRKIIDVRGCFWHMHSCGLCRIPRGRHKWWMTKLRRNVERDRAALRSLRRQGWKVLTVWECELAGFSKLARKLERFFR